MNGIVKIGNVELLTEDARRIARENKYIVCFSKIYRVFEIEDTAIFGRVVYSCPKGENLARRGRFHVMTKSEVISLIGEGIL